MRYSFQSKYERWRFYRIISLTEPFGQHLRALPLFFSWGKGSLGVRWSFFIGLFELIVALRRMED
ncbi:hypothetical protein M3625_08645 [Paenibacillus sp. MER 78]|nr:hypothetical protein [Paenibacillus sp. MER 78]